MMHDILYEDDELIVIHKPAGIATQTARIDQPDIVSQVTNYLARSSKAPPYLGVVHRLDQPVEGVLLFAKTKDAAAKLSRQQMEKKYYAIAYVPQKLLKEQGEKVLIDYLVKNGKDNISSVVGNSVKNAKRAELSYQFLKILEDNKETEVPVLTEVCLKTGRHHQIRVQMSHAGMPLLGDMKYGNEESIKISREKNINQVALCAYYLAFLHPTTKKKMEFSVKPKDYYKWEK